MSNVRRLYYLLLPVQIFLVIASGLSGIINGLIIGNFLNPESMRALGLATPMMSFLSGLASIVSGGAGILCGQCMGKGEIKKIDSVFSNAMMTLLFVGILLSASAFVFATPLATLLGAKNELILETKAYIQGISFGILPLLILPTLMVFLQMNNKSYISLLSTILIAVFNALFDFIAIKGFNGGIRGVGIASALSNYATVLFIIIYFIFNKGLVYFDSKLFDSKMIGRILAYGSPASLAAILYAVRNAFINKYALTVGGETAVSALAILIACGVFFDAFNIGVGSAYAMLVSVFIGEKDYRNLKNLMKITLVTGLAFAAMKLFIAYGLGDRIAMLFGAQGDIIPRAKELLCYYCWSAPFNIFTLILIGLFQSLGRVSFCNGHYILNCILVPLFCCTILSKFLGIQGIWILYAFSEVVTLTSIYITSSIRRKKVIGSLDDLLLNDGVFDANKISMTINNTEEVVNISEKIQSFCEENGIEHKRALYAGLCMEEMASNVIDHGFLKDNKPHSLDIFASVENDEVILRLRDNCVKFDPKSKLELLDENDPIKNIGIRMVYKIAKEINYQTTFGMNVLTIKL